MPTNLDNFQLTEQQVKQIKKDTRAGKVEHSILLYEDDKLTGMEVSRKDVRWFFDLQVMDKFGNMDRKEYINYKLNKLYNDEYDGDKRATPKTVRHELREETNARWDEEVMDRKSGLANSITHWYLKTAERDPKYAGIEYFEERLQDTLLGSVKFAIYKDDETKQKGLERINDFERVNILSDALPPTDPIMNTIKFPWYDETNDNFVGTHVDDHQFFKRYIMSEA